FAIGVLSAVMGVGGGFMLVPAMIYLLGMPTSVVIGTSLFQVVFVSANVTLLQAVQVGSVDIVLTLLLLAGGVAGAQFGAAMGTRLRGEEMRALLGLLVLIVASALFWDIVRTPDNFFAIGPMP
ncbi:MAG TPA: sulfite exporter TauE/SafE family protein, partial [Acetobacteraceae bacterium]|nr:sulfite exporter TauE/SafE family protein [Acetobacteraceae bacterium]